MTDTAEVVHLHRIYELLNEDERANLAHITSTLHRLDHTLWGKVEPGWEEPDDSVYKIQTAAQPSSQAAPVTA